MIAGKTVALGPILPVDIPALFRWSDDPAQAALNEPYRPHNWHRQEQFWLNTAGDPARLFFAVRARAAPDIIGYVQIRDIEPIHRSATIGIRIGERQERGRGAGTEALRLAIDYCWNTLNLSRIALTVFAGNDRADALYRRLGFRREGLFERALYINGRWIDLVAMALLHPDRREG